MSQPQIGARIPTVAVLEHGHRLADARVAVRRHLHHQHDVEIAASRALHVRDALAAEAQLAAALAPRGNLQLDGAVGRRHVDRRAVYRLAHGHRHLQVEIAAAPLETRVRPDARHDVEVARRGTADPGTALAGETNARAVVDARRNFHVQLLHLLDAATAVALGTRPLVDTSRSVAARAAAIERERPGADLRLPAAVAFGTRRPAALGTRAVAGRAFDGLRERDRRGRAANRAQEVDLERRFEVGAALRRFGAGELRAAAAEEIAEDVLEARVPAAEPARVAAGRLARAASDAAAETAAVCALCALELAGALGVEAALQPVHPELVVGLALRRIGQGVVGERYPLELLFRLAVPGIDVGMVLPRQLPVSLLDLLGGRRAFHAEVGVEVAFRHRGAAPISPACGRDASQPPTRRSGRRLPRHRRRAGRRELHLVLRDLSERGDDLFVLRIEEGS